MCHLSGQGALYALLNRLPYGMVERIWQVPLQLRQLYEPVVKWSSLNRLDSRTVVLSESPHFA